MNVQPPPGRGGGRQPARFPTTAARSGYTEEPIHLALSRRPVDRFLWRVGRAAARAEVETLAALATEKLAAVARGEIRAIYGADGLVSRAARLTTDWRLDLGDVA